MGYQQTYFWRVYITGNKINKSKSRISWWQKSDQSSWDLLLSRYQGFKNKTWEAFHVLTSSNFLYSSCTEVVDVNSTTACVLGVLVTTADVMAVVVMPVVTGGLPFTSATMASVTNWGELHVSFMPSSSAGKFKIIKWFQ